MIKVTFSLPFETKYGQEILIRGSIPELQGDYLSGTKQMSYSKGMWSLTILIKSELNFSYSYILKEREELIPEAGSSRKLDIRYKKDHIIYDSWRELSNKAPFLSSAFKKTLYKYNKKIKLSGDLIITVCAINISRSQKVIICGNCDFFGNWDPAKGREMLLNTDGLMEIGVPISSIPKQLEYKFVIKDSASHTGEEYLWEERENRLFLKRDLHTGSQIIINNFKIEIPSQKPRFAGTAIPLFSLRSNNSCGIGDIGDLKLMIDFLEATNQNILQLLPINDTTATLSKKDSYPYGAISGYALHPIYLNLEKLGKVKDREFRERHFKKSARLNALNEVDYESVSRAKFLYIRQIYNQEHEKTFKTEKYKKFFKKNEVWLVPYAFFCFLRNLNKTADFRKWPNYSHYNVQDALMLSSLGSEHYKEITIYYFAQYHLHKQLTEVHNYARSKKIVLKGDIPIGINANSVEAWTEPNLFDFNFVAGAPPDQFSSNGQIWGFPVYNWEAIKKGDFNWWKKRLEKMTEYFDAYRIDHILGFFRIWQLPQEAQNGLKGIFNPAIAYTPEEIFSFKFNESTNNNLFITDSENPNNSHPAISAKFTQEYKELGKQQKRAYDKLYNHFFYERNEELWAKTGLKRLRNIISSTDMLVCGEDLGMIPTSVPKVMEELGILSLEIERMPKVINEKFGTPHNYSYLSVCTTSTHDTSTLREWWEENYQNSQEYYSNHLKIKGTAPDTLVPYIAKKIIERHLKSPSLLTILPLQDWLSISGELRRESPKEERINRPEDPHNLWNYRMHITLESLLEDSIFKSEVKEMIKSCGRGF